MNKILIILAGSPRGGNKTWKSFIDNCKNPLNADLALCTTDKYVSNNILFKEAKYKWISKEYEDWFDYYKNEYSNKLVNYFKKGTNTGLYTSGLIHFAFKDIILKNYINIVNNYDFVIYSRFDQYYLSHPTQFEENKILIPEGEDYFGICDRHAIFPSKFAEQYFGICKYIDSSDTEKYSDPYLNCEVTYLNHLMNEDLFHSVKRIKRSQFTTAIKGDLTNWRVPKYKLIFFNKILLKYPDEFILTMKNNFYFRYSVSFDYIILLINYLILITRFKLGKFKKFIL